MTAQCKQKALRNDLQLPNVKNARETTLVDTGDSSQAEFSPDGKRLLFVSRGRPGHQHAQIYEKNLENGQELRITFQNGDTSFPRYHPKEGWILYASETDELKENPPLLAASSDLPLLPAAFRDPSELYMHLLQGLEITRLTDFTGFDGDARFTPDGQMITWTRARGEKLEVLAMNHQTRTVQTIRNLGVNPTQYTASPDNKWRAWVEWDASFGVAKLKLQKRPLTEGTLELVPDMVVPKTDLHFTPDSKWLLWSQLNTETSTHQLWSYEIETKCARRLSDNKDDDRRHPAVSPDMQRMVYSIQRKNRSRIAVAGFVRPSGPCVSSL